MTEARNNKDDKDLWKQTKMTIGWNTNLPPTILVYNGKTITNTQELANTLNREQILRNIRLRRKVPRTSTDPMTNYRKATDHIKTKFSLKEIRMHQFRQTLKHIKPSNSTGLDLISSKTVKNSNCSHVSD